MIADTQECQNPLIKSYYKLWWARVKGQVKVMNHEKMTTVLVKN